MITSTLFYIKMKQGINSLFIYSKKGWGMILIELIGLVCIIYAIMQGNFSKMDTSLLLLLAFIVLLGSSYISAEKYLSSAENQFDLLTGIQANNIIQANYGQVLCSNLRVASLLPLIVAASNQTLSPWLVLLTFLVFPVAATLFACVCNIMINRYLNRMAAVFYLLFAFLWGGAIVAMLGILLAKHNLSLATLDNRDTLLIILIFCAVSITILYFSSPLSALWREAYLQNDSMNKHRLPFIRFQRFSRLFANPFIAKEWFLLMRNAITKVRFIVWAALLIICSFTAIKSYLYDPTLFLIISLVVWLFCYGELPATAWQNESEQKSFYWLSGFQPSQLIAVKIAAFLPLTLFGIVTVLLLGFAIQLSLYVILQRAGLVFLLILAAIIISLALACLGHNSSQQIINNAMLEQVPLTMSAILAVSIEFLFCGIIFLPLPWILLLSISIPIICLIGQAKWLSRIYYKI